MTTGDTISYSVDGPVAVIALNKPKLNTLDIAVLDGLIAALRRAGGDDSIRAVILTSALEKAFCAGLDLEQVLDGGSAMMRALLQRLYIELFGVQHNLGKPSIAAVAGVARGGGTTLSLSCDVVLAADNASFGYPEFHVGILPGIHFTHLPRVVGRHKAFELLFGAAPFGASEAARLGLVNRVVDANDLMATAMTMARDFAAKPPQAIKLGRAAFMDINDDGYRQSIASVVETMALMIDSDETQDALRRFLKRS
jgi:enoyl-CoA hydratase/carnithine racemase